MTADSLSLVGSTFPVVALFRINPGRYFYYSLSNPAPGRRLVFFVDSADGAVDFLELYP